MEKTFYLCDPEKNTACRKTNCAYNPKAFCRDCFTTSKAECARIDEDGEPCKQPDWVFAENRLREKLFEIEEKVSDFLEAVRELVFHAGDTGRR